MTKHGEGLSYEIVKAVNNGEITEPITTKKVRDFCKKKGLNPSENQMNVVLSNATENTHSPTYKKYFERVAVGEYVIRSNFRKQLNFYWLNIDSESYMWSFSDVKVGKRQTYSNINKDGSNRRNLSCFQSIDIGDKVLAYETGVTKAITTICEVVSKEIKNNIIFVEFEKLLDFGKFLSLDEMKANQNLSDCDVVGFHRGTLFQLRQNHYDEINRILETINAPIDYYEEFEKAVRKSRDLSTEERKKRLARREKTIPDRISRNSFGFVRSHDVVADVLERANGICEHCGSPAPFIKAYDGTPYLEVHHKIRLVDGGEDTVDNAMAVCPNCHREFHFG